MLRSPRTKNILKNNRTPRNRAPRVALSARSSEGGLDSFFYIFLIFFFSFIFFLSQKMTPFLNHIMIGCWLFEKQSIPPSWGMVRDDSPADCSSGTICLASARRVEGITIFYLIIFFLNAERFLSFISTSSFPCGEEKKESRNKRNFSLYKIDMNLFY